MDYAMILAGLLSLVGGIVMVVVPIRKWLQRKKVHT